MSKLALAFEILEQRIPDPTNEQIIAECIRQELADAPASGITTERAEEQVTAMIVSEFFVDIVQRFVIKDGPSFGAWSVVVQYRTGEMVIVDQDS